MIRMVNTALLLSSAFFCLGSSVPAHAQGKTQPGDPREPMPFAINYGSPISAARARAVISAGVAECDRRGWNMVFAVVDSGGNLVSLERMDGAQTASIAIAEHKAKAAAAFRRETKVFETAVQNGNVGVLSLDGAIASPGGIPLVEAGKIIGAIGVSGGSGAQDQVCASAGMLALGK